MKLNELFSPKRILFILVFSALILLGTQIELSYILGVETQTFTLFQFFGPMSGMFLGPVFGAITVLLAQIGNNVVAGKALLEPINLIRLMPMVFAAFYFGAWKSKKLQGNLITTIVPLAAMAAFILHPVGQQTWYYSLYWLIPIVAKLSDRLFLKSLGTTFTAHAIGSVAFLYTIPTTPELWAILIPIVAVERLLFASGISISYIVFNTVLSKIHSITGTVHTDKRYDLLKARA